MWSFCLYYEKIVVICVAKVKCLIEFQFNVVVGADRLCFHVGQMFYLRRERLKLKKFGTHIIGLHEYRRYFLSSGKDYRLSYFAGRHHIQVEFLLSTFSIHTYNVIPWYRYQVYDFGDPCCLNYSAIIYYQSSMSVALGSQDFKKSPTNFYCDVFCIVFHGHG